MKKILLPLSLALSLSILPSCQPEQEVETDPAKVLNSIVKPYGFIGFQNAMNRSDTGTHTGLLVGGRPDALAYVASHDTCFPQGDSLRREQHRANIQRKYNYSFKGNFGFLSLGLPIVSAAFGLQKSMTVDIEINGLVIEYLDSVDVTDWYRDGINPTCKEYLNEVGFLIQTIHTDSMKISIKRLGGTNIGLSSENVSDFFSFEAGVNWEILDAHTIEIKTPHTLGYQIALIKEEDNGKALYRAMSTVDQKFLFEKIGFADNSFSNEDTSKQKSIMVEESMFVE